MSSPEPIPLRSADASFPGGKADPVRMLSNRLANIGLHLTAGRRNTGRYSVAGNARGARDRSGLHRGPRRPQAEIQPRQSRPRLAHCREALFPFRQAY